MGPFDWLITPGFALTTWLLALAAGGIVALLGILAAIARLILKPLTALAGRFRPRRFDSQMTGQGRAAPPAMTHATVATEATAHESAIEPMSDRPGADDPPPSEDRRRFLTRLSFALGGLAGAILGVPTLGVLVAPLRRETTERWRPVGTLDEFAVGSTSQIEIVDPDPLPWAGPAALQAAWLRRDNEQQFTAFSAYCTHIGCPVRWEEGAGLFMCPCHGGVFHRDGSVAAGPPPQPLAQYPVRVRPDGTVEVRTSPVPLPSAQRPTARTG